MPSIKRGTTRAHVARHLAEAIAAVPHEPADRWWDDAACRGVDVNVFIADRTGPAPREAVGYCAACSVRVDCAIAHADEVNGVWGGIGPFARRDLRAAIAAKTGEVIVERT